MLKVKSLNGLSFLHGISKILLVPTARELATDCTIRVYFIQISVYLFLIRSRIIFVYFLPWGFFSEANDGTMCPGVDSASKNEYQKNSWE
jgi:hypothetical protein